MTPVDELRQVREAMDEACGLLDSLDPQHGITRQLHEALAILDRLSETCVVVPREEVWEMRLCEQNHLVLRPDQLYTFKVDLACAKCLKLRAEYDEILGPLAAAEREGG